MKILIILITIYDNILKLQSLSIVYRGHKYRTYIDRR